MNCMGTLAPNNILYITNTVIYLQSIVPHITQLFRIFCQFTCLPVTQAEWFWIWLPLFFWASTHLKMKTASAHDNFVAIRSSPRWKMPMLWIGPLLCCTRRRWDFCIYAAHQWILRIGRTRKKVYFVLSRSRWCSPHTHCPGESIGQIALSWHLSDRGAPYVHSDAMNAPQLKRNEFSGSADMFLVGLCVAVNRFVNLASFQSELAVNGNAPGYGCKDAMG